MYAYKVLVPRMYLQNTYFLAITGDLLLNFQNEIKGNSAKGR